ncbi:PilZ domain-containing protein [Brevundimonas sp. UBA7534]|uniref:PilZ domain-containing protein n=1 Tax=Brevundimonas sp. UBA7534 TaxID=1946138 RepID=UPI0025C606CC|nr:PilZ domain-containing protein [Brevundimonas sp. UBA7534]
MSLFGSKFGRAPDPADRRQEPRRAANARGVVVASTVETACLIVDQSAAGFRLRLDRSAALPREVVVIEVAEGLAYPGVVVWQKGQKAGIKQAGPTSLRGLVPARMTAAREAWLRAGGR